jgi:hypothetical protein
VCQNFGRYADWRLKDCHITKQSTVGAEWKFRRLPYKRETGRKMDELIGEQAGEPSQRPRAKNSIRNTAKLERAIQNKWQFLRRSALGVIREESPQSPELTMPGRETSFGWSLRSFRAGSCEGQSFRLFNGCL